MNHLELCAVESQSALGTSQSDRAWSRFLRDIEVAIGGNSDGDGEENGYSMDEAYDFFRARKSSALYIKTITSRPNFVVRAWGT